MLLIPPKKNFNKFMDYLDLSMRNLRPIVVSAGDFEFELLIKGIEVNRSSENANQALVRLLVGDYPTRVITKKFKKIDRKNPMSEHRYTRIASFKLTDGTIVHDVDEANRKQAILDLEDFFDECGMPFFSHEKPHAGEFTEYLLGIKDQSKLVELLMNVKANTKPLKQEN